MKTTTYPTLSKALGMFPLTKRWNWLIRNRKQSLLNNQKPNRTREHRFIQWSISNNAPLTINEKENMWGYCIGAVSGKIICHWEFKPGSRVHQPHTCPNRFSYEQTSTSCLCDCSNSLIWTRQWCMPYHKHQTKALSRKNMGIQWPYRGHSPWSQISSFFQFLFSKNTMSGIKQIELLRSFTRFP
jgi:hypothetical protein